MNTQPKNTSTALYLPAYDAAVGENLTNLTIRASEYFRLPEDQIMDRVHVGITRRGQDVYFMLSIEA